MCRTLRINSNGLADRPKTGPENIAGAFGLKMRIRWCINMWKTIKLYFRGRCAGVPSFTNKMVLESLFNKYVKSYPIFSYLYTIGIGFSIRIHRPRKYNLIVFHIFIHHQMRIFNPNAPAIFSGPVFGRSAEPFEFILSVLHINSAGIVV